MTNPTPEDFFEAANLLQDVASQYRPVAISSNQSDTDLLAEAVKVIEFYADKVNYDFRLDERETIVTVVELDEGQRARDFLAKLGR